jgi:hypothetical protein
MLNGVTFRPTIALSQAEEPAPAEPQSVRSHTRGVQGPPSETPPEPGPPPWLAPSNFELLRRVAQAVTTRSSSGG